MTNANEALTGYNGTEEFFEYNHQLIITEGVKALADRFECFWFLDVIASYQPQLKDEDFQVWVLTKYEDGSASVVCTDGNYRPLKAQSLDFTDFSATKATVWVEQGTALLPSEH